MPLACPSPIAALAPQLCTAVDAYCERTSDALDAEPLNAVSNAAFLVAAWCAWRLLQQHPQTGPRGLIGVLVAVVAIVGLGSFTFHTIATGWAALTDVVPIFAFMLLYLWLALRHFFGWAKWQAASGVAVFFAVTFLLEAVLPAAVPGAMYLPALATLWIIALALMRSQFAAGRAMAMAAGVFTMSFALRTIDRPLCEAWPMGTHFAWHMFNGLLLYLLLRAAILSLPKRE